MQDAVYELGGLNTSIGLDRCGIFGADADFNIRE